MRSLSCLVLLLASGCFDDDCPGDSTDTTTDTTTQQTSTGVLTCADVDRSLEGEAVPTDDGDVTLSGVYRVSGAVTYDSDEVVTIEPGTIFLMEAGSEIRWGWRSDPAAVFAEGTAEEPILFCGTEDTPGHWLGLALFTGTREDSRLAHVVVEDAGLDDAAALWLQQPADLVSVQLVDNLAVGLEAEALGAGSMDLQLSGNGSPAHLSNGSTITNLPEGTYTGNVDDRIQVSHTSDEDVVFHDRGVPYLQTDDRVVYGRADGVEVSVVYEAGVEYQFCQDCSIHYGWRGDPAVVEAIGTPEAPVVFTSDGAVDMPGAWDGVHLDTGLASDTRFENVVFEYGGKADGGAANGANVLVQGGLGSLVDCTFADSAGYGLWLGRVEAGFVEQGSVFVDNGQGDIGS